MMRKAEALGVDFDPAVYALYAASTPNTHSI